MAWSNVRQEIEELLNQAEGLVKRNEELPRSHCHGTQADLRDIVHEVADKLKVRVDDCATEIDRKMKELEQKAIQSAEREHQLNERAQALIQRGSKWQ